MGHPARAETLEVDRELRIPAGTGAGLRVAAGECGQIVDVEGRGSADFFTLAAATPVESLRRPMLPFEEDRTPGVHAMLFAACDPARHAQGHVPGHASCAENFHPALRALGASCPVVPQPVTFFMNVAARPDGRVTFGRLRPRPGTGSSSAPSWTAGS